MSDYTIQGTVRQATVESGGNGGFAYVSIEYLAEDGGVRNALIPIHTSQFHDSTVGSYIDITVSTP